MTTFILTAAAVAIVISFMLGLCVGQSAAYRHVRGMESRKAVRS